MWEQLCVGIVTDNELLIINTGGPAILGNHEY